MQRHVRQHQHPLSLVIAVGELALEKADLVLRQRPSERRPPLVGALESYCKIDPMLPYVVGVVASRREMVTASQMTR